MSTATNYEIIRRTLTDGQLVQALQADLSGTLSQLGISDPTEVEELTSIFAWMFSGASQQTRNGEEYGYIVDSVIVHDYRTGKTFYIYCWDFEREKKTDMRGVEPEYTNFRVIEEDKVEIEVRKKGKIDGYGLLDVKAPSFEYRKNERE